MNFNPSDQEIRDYLYKYLMLHNGNRMVLISAGDLSASSECKERGYIDTTDRRVTKLGREFLSEETTNTIPNGVAY